VAVLSFVPYLVLGATPKANDFCLGIGVAGLIIAAGFDFKAERVKRKSGITKQQEKQLLPKGKSLVEAFIEEDKPSYFGKKEGDEHKRKLQRPHTMADQNLGTDDDKALASEGRERMEFSRQTLGKALCNAAEAGDVNEVKRLLVQGADPNFETGPKCATPILIAAHRGYTDVVRILISTGANINKQNTDGLTPLMAASMSGHVETLTVLCENNADLNFQTVMGKYTALMLTITSTPQKDAFKFLIDRGADISLRDEQGDTVLEIAKYRKLSEFLSLLESSKKDNIEDPKEEKIRKIKEVFLQLFSQGEQFDIAFEALFSALKDKDPEIKAIASIHLAQSPVSIEKLISIYKTSIATDKYRAILAGRVLGRKLSQGKPETIMEEITAMRYGIRVAFTSYECKYCGKFNIGIPVPTRWLSFYGQKNSMNANNALPVLCDFCNNEFFLCWD
jgi:hypothetical protein